MSKKKIYIYSLLLALILFYGIFSLTTNVEKDFSEKVKVSLRNVGHQVLLSNGDVSSLVLPILKLEELKYQISFQKKLSINPDNLTSIIKDVITKAKLAKSYRVEVVQCNNKEIAYSYEVNEEKNDNLIPCKGRILSDGCYLIEVKFLKKRTPVLGNKLFVVGLFLLFLIFFIDYTFFKKKKTEALIIKEEEHATIGSFKFYPDQNKLIKQATEISLSKKECELLAIFVAKPNQIIKRDELTKKVWEDKGVFVGRSLDTYISKLRKKLKEDKNIKLTNIHGVGYKLEII